MQTFNYVAAIILLAAPFLQTCVANPIPEAAGAAVEARQAFNWGHPTDPSVIACGNGDACTNGRNQYLSCINQYPLTPPAGGSLEARAKLVATCLCTSYYTSFVTGCLTCLENGNPTVLTPVVNTYDPKLCAGTMGFAQYQGIMYELGQLTYFPLYLPSLVLTNIPVTLPDEIPK